MQARSDLESPSSRCDSGEEINERPIRFAGVRCKARDAAAKVLGGERSVFVNRPCEKSLAERAVGNEADSEFFERRQYFFFRAFPPERVFTLNRSHG